ncbi:hypothetical protein M8C21_031415 [Ambrosia artemisiifolia]|uniref:FHA domain-containing protein n=1 Tax=Ambrosia artemisiifolia TaxID=4212 RepID=A0AAD5C900_AMBAR|nr:hypothetical protein M8C21_031415 [Ambrosia artemisiifolia]
MKKKTCDLLLKCSIENFLLDFDPVDIVSFVVIMVYLAGASLEALAEGNKKIRNKRKGGSLCIHYHRKRRRIKSNSFNSPDLSFFDKCIKLQDHATLNHQAHVGDVMFGDCLENNFGSIATADLVDKSAHGCHDSVQDDSINGSMREDGLCKLTESVCFLLRDNLISFFDSGIEPEDDTHMHDKGDSYKSGDATEVEYASLPDSPLSFLDKDYVVCSLNTEDTIDDIPDSQLLDSPENFLEESSFHDDQQDVYHSEDDVSDKDYIVCSLNTEDTVDDIPDSQLLDSPEIVFEESSFHDYQQDVCHSEDDVESTSISHLDTVYLREGKITCFLNTEDPEIPCNDNIFSVIYPSPHVRSGTATESVDSASSISQSHMDGPNLSSEYESANPHVGYTHKSVSTDHNPSISDHNSSDSNSDLPGFPDIEDPEIPCNDNMLLLIHQSPSVRHRTALDSSDQASSFTQSQMKGTGLSSEFDSANPHDGCTLKSVSMEHNPSMSDHNNSDSNSDMPRVPGIEDPEIPSQSVRPQTATDSINPASCYTRSQMNDAGLSSEFDSAIPHVGCTSVSVSMEHNPSISDCNSDSDLPCFLDTEDPEVPSPSVRPQTATDSIDHTSCFTRSQIDDSELSSEIDSANLHVLCTLKPVSMDLDPSISDYNSDIDLADLICFPELEDPEIPSPSVRLQTATGSIDPASSFSRSQMDSPDLSSEFDSAHPHVGNALKDASVDHNPSISDNNNSDNDSDLPCFPDIEALILKLDFEYAQESWITNEVKRGKYKHSKRTINSLQQCLSQKAMSSLGAFAVFYSHRFNYFIKKTEVTIGRSTDDCEVDIDLRKESRANMISRQQAIIKMETDGTFTLKNIGKGSILVNGESIAHWQVAALGSRCLIQIRGMDFMFDINDRYIRWYLDDIMKKPQGKFTTFEWSVN